MANTLDLISWESIFKEESQQRLDTDIKKLCCYGIKPLDDALGGIRPNDLVVIGSDSGVGKSELGLNIARINAQKGKKVAVYYLEGGHIEAMQRMKYRDIADVYFTQFRQEKLNMDYVDWVNNQINDPKGILKKIEAQIYDRYKNDYRDNLLFFKVESDFTIESFLMSLYDRHKLIPARPGSPFAVEGIFDLDLVIIDHLQYFSLSKGENEIGEITKILRQVKDISDKHKIPVVLFSHLRKKSKDRGLPDQEDFYGSSNIPKISSTSIIISPDYNNDDLGNGIFPTFFRIVKSRVGIRPNYAIRANFDSSRRKYSDDYELFLVNRDGQVAKQPLSADKLPNWMKIKNVGLLESRKGQIENSRTKP